MAAAAPSVAAPVLTFTTSDGTFSVDPFGGFDWNSNATVVASAPVYDGSTVLTASYLASARAIRLANGTDGTPANIGVSYEFTIRATMFQVATCLVTDGSGCQSGQFTSVGGSWDLYFDTTPDANIVNGSGFTDGLRVLGAAFDGGVSGSFITTSPGSGTGAYTFSSGVNFTETDNTEAAFLSTAPSGMSLTMNWLSGSSTTSGWTAPTSWANGGGIPPGASLYQAAVGTQTFRFPTATAVPEPGTLALVGISLAGLGLARRRLTKA